MPKYKQYSPILASNFEQKGQENTTSYNLPYWPCYHGRNVRVNNFIKHIGTLVNSDGNLREHVVFH